MPTRLVYQTPNQGYARRLRTFLSDEEYGPKLVRLNRSQQQEILQLINDNRGRDARRRVVELDEERRSENRIAARARKYAKLTKRQRHDEWRDTRDWAEEQDASPEFWAIYQGLVKA